MYEDNEYFELSSGEKRELRDELVHDLQQLVINICSERDELVNSIDYNEFGSIVQGILQKAVKEIDCSYLCGYAWGANGR